MIVGEALVNSIHLDCKEEGKNRVEIRGKAIDEHFRDWHQLLLIQGKTSGGTSEEASRGDKASFHQAFAVTCQQLKMIQARVRTARGRSKPAGAK